MLNLVKPTNSLDTASLIHDIEYLYYNQNDADKNFVRNLENNGNFILAPLTKLAFKFKDLFGYEVSTKPQLYHLLKSIAQNKLIDNKNFRFIES